jgi:hypothetical protein
MPDKVAAISLLVAKSTEVGKSKATKVIFFKKEYLVILKPAAIPSLQIFSAITKSFTSHPPFLKIARFQLRQQIPLRLRYFCSSIHFESIFVLGFNGRVKSWDLELTRT